MQNLQKIIKTSDLSEKDKEMFFGYAVHLSPEVTQKLKRIGQQNLPQLVSIWQGVKAKLILRTKIKSAKYLEARQKAQLEKILDSMTGTDAVAFMKQLPTNRQISNKEAMKKFSQQALRIVNEAENEFNRNLTDVQKKITKYISEKKSNLDKGNLSKLRSEL